MIGSGIRIEEQVYIGENGFTEDKQEGDGKTPIGDFKIGKILGMINKESIKINKDIEYTQIHNNLYWVDDINSKYYNQMVDITKIKKDWNSAEHLIDYKEEYKYAVEIKVNPNNISGKGSAIFLHCSTGKPTKGCIAISYKTMKCILENIPKDTIISIKKH